MGEPSKSNTTTGLVSSGSGRSVNADAISAGEFAYGALGPGNASLLDTNTILPNTRRANISKTQLNEADHNYTTAMNRLSTFWTSGDTSSGDYLTAKQDAMTAQYKWELARNNLEEVTNIERGALSENTLGTPEFPDLDISASPIDLSGLDNSLSTSLTSLDSTDSAPDGEEIVVVGTKIDQRIRIRAKSGAAADSLYTGVLSTLKETNGVFFPFTPLIQFSHRAEYGTMQPTHANTTYYSYTNSPAVQIQIQGQFSSQNLTEAKYTLAAMHFFRTVTKMHFGREDENAGLPPPVLILSGYGEFMFDELNVIITEFSMELPDNVDYIEVEVDGNLAWVPALTTFNVTCVVQQTPRMQRDDFNLNKFASGEMMGMIKGWI